MSDQVKYFDRELSWVQFNRRVLSEAMDASNPVMERLKFLGIVSSNFDEFFMVRIPGISDPEAAKRVYGQAFELIDQQNQYFMDVLVKELEKHGIRRITPEAFQDRQIEYVKNLFHRELLPLLTPVALREDAPLPILASLSLYRILELSDPQGPGKSQFAVIEIPKNFPRMITIPSDSGFVFLLAEDLISLYMKELFQGYEVLQDGLMRITRASELSLDEEKDEDFATTMSEALRLRRGNDMVRLEIAATDSMVHFLSDKLEIPDFKIYRQRAWFDLKGISQLAFRPQFEDLKRPAWTPQPNPDFAEAEDLWKLVREKDILVHQPYESFDSFIRFISEAASDPDVLAIKQTLYRAAEPSAVIPYLEKAAENGKQVTVLVELKARFDEARNIGWARRLVNAGATVLYGIAGLKTHAKACLVVRREVDGIRRYLHLSTGNYNEVTAQIYTDFGFFTSNEDLTRDVASLFNFITGFSHPSGFSKIEISPFGLRRKIKRLILRESLRSNREKPGVIIAKMNSLVDPEVIDLLYKASNAGVQIKLMVRGICCLRPGVKGQSENIEVTSLVDMFLEHSRIYYFYNGGDEELYLSSADWMPRNFDRRLEVMFPVENEKTKKNLLDILKIYFKDNTKSWKLLPDGNYQRYPRQDEKEFRVQEYLRRLAEERKRPLIKEDFEILKAEKIKKEIKDPAKDKTLKKS